MIGSSGDDGASSVQETADGGFTVVGTTRPLGVSASVHSYASVLKLDQTCGIIGCGAITIVESLAVTGVTSVVPVDSTAALAASSSTAAATEITPSSSIHAAVINCLHTPAPAACSAMISSDLGLHIPVINVQGRAYWADFRYVPNTLDFVLMNAGLVVDDTSFRECAHSVLSYDFRFVLPDIIFAGKSHWAQLTYREGLTVTLTKAGEN